ncbi:MAG TPA: metal ABC transporter substrate-binding protein [Nitrospirales bacterium]|jgi:ABC-type Zn uptake system ZnuABC Zn-binding protein ZnuA|nr:metal ABC transporter substrate-binding protein [Nitrospirales bacterium]
MTQRLHNFLYGVILVVIFLAAGIARAEDKIYVVTTLPDLADITGRIGGDLVTVESLAKGIEDPHGIPMKPSFVPKLNRAQVVVLMGLEYEHSWLPGLLLEARNQKILKGQSGYIDVSIRVTPKEVPTDLSRARGELHPLGNPHFNLDPEGGRLIAQAIAEGLTLNFPQHRKKFESNLKEFLAQLDAKLREWEAMAKPLKGVKFISYHADFTYFADRFGLDYVGTIEFKPGIEPTAAHLVELMQNMKTGGVKIVLREPHFSEKVPNQIANEVGGLVVKLPIMVGGVPEVKTYFDLIEYNLRTLLKAAQAAGVAGKV